MLTHAHRLARCSACLCRIAPKHGDINGQGRCEQKVKKLLFNETENPSCHSGCSHFKLSLQEMVEQVQVPLESWISLAFTLHWEIAINYVLK